MRELIKKAYQLKIKTLFYFSLGYGEVSNLVSLMKDIVIILGFASLVLRVHVSIRETVGLGIIAFCGFTLLGWLLKQSGMSDYAVKTSNNVNPEMKLIRKIAKHLNIEE